MKRNIYTTSAKDYYDNAPMMDMYSFLASEGYDINNNPQITKEVLDKLYKNKTILWATDIRHSMGVYRNGAVIDMHLAHNEICACRVVKIKKEYYLKDIGVMPIKDIGVKDNEEYEELFNTDDSKYGGSGQIMGTPLFAEKVPFQNQPYSLKIKVPPMATLILKVKDIVTNEDKEESEKDEKEIEK